MPKYKLDIPKNYITKQENGPVLCSWSGGASSAVACFIAFEHFPEDCVFIHMQTNIEHPDTYRFLFDFERRLGVTIQKLQAERWHEPEDVWRHYGQFKYPNGAPCSSALKRDVGLKFRTKIKAWSQVMGFDSSTRELKRATNFSLNHPELNPVYPLIQNGLDKQGVFQALRHIGLTPPSVYGEFKNNNCLGDPDSPKGGCIQGGIGYWKKIQSIYPRKFEYMAAMEHELTDRRGSPVTVLTHTVDKIRMPLFLKPHPNYPEIQNVSAKKGMYVVESFECHGFCRTEETQESDTQNAEESK